MRHLNPVARGYRRPEVDKSKDPEFWKAWDAKIDALTAKRTAELPENWPQSRQLAILMIARTDIALDCMAKLSGSNIRPRQHDFAALRNHGYAEKKLGDRYHRLTRDGWKAAETCAWALAKALKLHHVRFEFDSYVEHKARCCCGWVQCMNRRNNNGAARYLQERAREHIEAMKGKRD